MKIELKSIVMIPAMSGPFDAFTAKLYINDRYAANVQNGGRDIVNQIDPEGPDERLLIKEAEAYCLTLPPDTAEMNGKTQNIKMDLNLFIDNLVTDHLVKRARQRFKNRIDKEMKSGIVIGIPGDSESISVLGFKTPIDTMLSQPAGRETIKMDIRQIIVPALKDGVIILNTNIDEGLLKEAGVKAGQYAMAAGPQKQKTGKKAQRKL